MPRERQRHAHPDRLPRRPVDRIEDLVIWMLITLGLLTAVLAATVAARRYGEEMHRVELETRERSQVQRCSSNPHRSCWSSMIGHGPSGWFRPLFRCATPLRTAWSVARLPC
jgi:hypothetical protein